MANDSPLTPMMAQYRRIKSELPPDALLLFRLGDFYEMFFEDAQTGAQLLNVALTKRGNIPMCGLPYHAAPSYLGRLLKAGKKVALCDQMEEARPGQIVKREVTQILSPGAHFDERLLNPDRNNFLTALYKIQDRFGVASIDLTTGDFRAAELEDERQCAAEIDRLRPAEIIFPSEASTLRALADGRCPAINGYEDWTFAPETAVFTLKDHLKVASLDGFGLKDRPAATGAAAGALHYLTVHLRRNAAHLNRLVSYECGDYLALDIATARSLEILEPLRRDAPRQTSLYGAVNRSVTPMGARHLRQWLSQPLAAAEPIERRQTAIESWLGNPEALRQFRERLAEVRDLERTIGRLSTGAGNARDLLALKLGLQEIPTLRDLVASAGASGLPPSAGAVLRELIPLENPAPAVEPPPALLRHLAADLIPLPEIVALIAKSMVDEPPLALKEGGLIRDGFDADLDELRRAMTEGKDWIARLQQNESERTGIPSLKIRYNSVFGYYIEITKTHLNKVPPEYRRKQTVAGGERFITPELKEIEGKILGAEERSVKLEHDLFLQTREKVLAEMTAIQAIARALGDLDALAGLAETARLHRYCRPMVGDAGILEIKQGRHPILDQALVDERFVSNDTELDLTSKQIALITGPNMAGKSTYIRQVALLTLLAHTGSFVPAETARIDLVDRLFTRIGASDDLARGQSTFMVEMSETANLLNNATQRSLIILDEIGRGTSTFDGLSLAWAIVEHLHHRVGAKTLFATHYHELTELAGRLPRLQNYNVAVREWNDQIVFLRKIVPGGTDKSYGIQVARLAGVPKEVLGRAKEILSNLEATELTPEGKTRPLARSRPEREKLKQLGPPPQLDWFGNL